MHLSADVLEAIWRLLARRHAVVVVGPELARKYRRARRLLAITCRSCASAIFRAPPRRSPRATTAAS